MHCYIEVTRRRPKGASVEPAYSWQHVSLQLKPYPPIQFPKPSQYSTMRLLNVHTFKLHEFIGNDIPPYAILSHRWEDEEVTFQALQAGDGPEMKGWKKIEGCCRQAVADHFVYVVSLRYEISLSSCLSKSC